MKKTRFLALLLAVLMMAATALAEPAKDDPVVVQVGDVAVLLSEVQPYFDELYAYYSEEYKAEGLTLTADEINYILDQAISEMWLTAVMDIKVAEYGLSEITEEEKAALLEEITLAYEEYLDAYIEYSSLSKEEAEEDLIANGITVESQYALMLENLPYNRLIDKLTEGVEVTEEEIQAEYATYVEEQRASYAEDAATFELYTMYYGEEIFFVPEGFRFVKHILLNLPGELSTQMQALEEEISECEYTLETLNEEMYALENVDAESEAEAEPRDPEEIQKDIDAQQEALEAVQTQYEALKETILPQMQATIDEIMAKLAAGESFDSLIEAYGNDPGMQSTPEGYKVHKDSFLYDTTFRDASMALEAIGDVSEPVITGFGIHLIQYTGDVPSGPVPISEENYASLHDSLLSNAEQVALNEVLLAWQQEFPLESNPTVVVLPEVTAAEEPAAEEAGEEEAPEEEAAEEEAAEEEASEGTAEDAQDGGKKKKDGE